MCALRVQLNKANERIRRSARSMGWQTKQRLAKCKVSRYSTPYHTEPRERASLSRLTPNYSTFGAGLTRRGGESTCTRDCMHSRVQTLRALEAAATFRFALPCPALPYPAHPDPARGKVGDDSGGSLARRTRALAPMRCSFSRVLLQTVSDSQLAREISPRRAVRKVRIPTVRTSIIFAAAWVSLLLAGFCHAPACELSRLTA